MLIAPDSGNSHRNNYRGSDNFSPIAGRTRVQQNPVLMAPLQQAVGVGGQPVFVKVPFTTSDFMIWNESAGSYRENQVKMDSSLKMITENHNPDWQDIQVFIES